MATQTPTFALTGNPLVDGAIASALMFAAGNATQWAIANHFLSGDPTALTLAAFGILGGIATAIWRWYNTRGNRVQSVQAGINLALSGNSVNVPALPAASVVTPKPVTPESAQAIVRNFSNVKVVIPDGSKLNDLLSANTIVIAGKNGSG